MHEGEEREQAEDGLGHEVRREMGKGNGGHDHQRRPHREKWRPQGAAQVKPGQQNDQPEGGGVDQTPCLQRLNADQPEGCQKQGKERWPRQQLDAAEIL